MFKQLAGQVLGEEVVEQHIGKLAAFMPAEPPEHASKDDPAQRWEKALLALKGIAQQVTKVDEDGIEVFVCGEDVQDFAGIRDTKGLMRICDRVQPKGGLCLAPALAQALGAATERLYGEEGDQKEQAILVLLSRKPDDAEELVAAVQEAAAKVRQEGDLSITFVHVGNDGEAEEFLGFLDENLKVTSEETGEAIDIVDTLKDEDIKKAFEESQDPGFMAKGGAGALMGAFAGMAAGAGGYYAYQKHQISKRTKGFNGSWYVIGWDGQKTSLHLKIKDDMEGALSVKGYPEEDPEDFEDEGDDEDWDGQQDCPCCLGRGYFDKWCRPCEESAMHKDMDCPVCAGEGVVEGEMKRCKKCKGKGAFSCFGKPCMKNHMHFEKDCPRCEGRCFLPLGEGEEPEEEEEEAPRPPLHGRSTSHAKYQGENVFRYTADESEVIPGTVEDDHTVAFEDGTRWEEKQEKVSYGKMALAGLGGAALGGAAGYVIQKKFFSKASKKTPADYVIILDRSAAMAEMD